MMSEIIPLTLSFNYNGVEQTLHPVVIKNGSRLLLVDVPYPNQYLLLVEALALVDILIADVTDVVITHHDIDHMGCLAQLISENPSINVLSSVWEAPYISGMKKSQRLAQAEALYDGLPDETKAGAFLFQKMLEDVVSVHVDVELKDKQPLPFFADVMAIYTPGHTVGHLSLIHLSSNSLIAGDALVVENDGLVIANPQYTLDMPEALASIEKLRQYKIDTVYCYHGGVWKGDVHSELKLICN